MRRIVAIALLVPVAALALLNVAADDDEEYLVRAYFDNAGFLVKSEEVRVAGAKVGTIAEVDVSREGETVSEERGAIPGKAVVVLDVDDDAFQDFRQDASCLIRPQSLLGEKFVECEPTQPRAAGTEPPPPLEPIPDGERGAGQLFLPLERNGKAVDLDLVNNITREPEVDRFRLILNDLGAALAARGDDLNEVLERANPALRQTNEVLRILAEQNQNLAQLAADSDEVLAPLAEERESLAGFIRNATTTAQATADQRQALAETFVEAPPALSELEQTMVELRRFAEEGTPVARDLGAAAPALTRATRELGPFSEAGTTAITTLGIAADSAGDDLVASEPVLRDLRGLAESTAPGAEALRRLLRSLRQTGGIDFLMEFVLNSSNTFNGFDEFGHFLRANLLITNCVDYVTSPLSGCGANWTGAGSEAAATAPSPPPTAETLRNPGAEEGADDDETAGPGGSTAAGGAGPSSDGSGGDADEGSSAPATDPGVQEDLFDFLMEDGP